MKRILSLFLVLVLSAALLCGCNGKKNDDSYIMTATINGERIQLPNGPYRYYLQWWTDYYYSYIATMAAQMQKQFDWQSMLIDTSLTAPDTLSEYIVNYAKDQYLAWLYIDREFDRLGLKLTDADEKIIDNMIQSDWVAIYGNDKFNTIRKSMDLSYDEFRAMMATSVKSNAIIDYYYGENGTNAVSEAEKKDYFSNNYTRFKYIVMMLVDSDGNELSEEKIAEVETNRDTVLEKLEKGASFEDLLREYSEDFNLVTDDMTDTEKENYAKQNQAMLEDGLVTDRSGVFSESLANYYNITLDEAIVDKVFSLKDGEYAAVTINDSIWIVKVYDKNEKESYYEGVKTACYKGLYQTDFSSRFTTWSNTIDYAYNEACLKTYCPENMAQILDFSSKSGAASVSPASSK